VAGPNPSSQLRRGQPSRQLEQCQRIAACFGDDPVAYALVELERHRRGQQGTGVSVAQAADLEPGHVLELVTRLARSEHESHTLCPQATGDEGERQCRGLIQPLRVIDDAQDRALLSRLREKGQHGQPDQQAIRRRAGASAKDDL
jgi:hypothetical protein